MDGIFLIDKPKNMSSFEVVKHIRKKFNVSKVGHAGTLDPFATGLLVILVGRATKIASLFLNQKKSYQAMIKFGEETDTQDYLGKKKGVSEYLPSINEVKEQLLKMKEYFQVPPMFSAKKIAGKKLYEYARKGLDVKREKVKIKIHNHKIVDYNPPFLELSLTVSKGTYIRTIADDLGKRCKTFGHVLELKRISSGKFNIRKAKCIETIGIDDLVTFDEIFQENKKIILNEFLISKVKNGLVLDSRQYNKEEPFCVYNKEGEFIAYYVPTENNSFKPVIN